jgi:single-stranded DNA-binding protein
MTEVVASDLVLLGGRGEGAGGGESSTRGVSTGGNNNFDQREPEPASATSSPITDEDIPF